MSHPEKILVVPRAKLESLAKWQGFLPAHRLSLTHVLAHAELRVRDEVEDDSSFRQLIPYVFFRWKGDCGPLLFCYTRGRSGAESRLHRRRSLGIGGHVEEADFGGDPARFTATDFRMARDREVREEVEHDASSEMLMGYLADDSDAVGRVHVGVVFEYVMRRPIVRSREPGTLDEAGWISASLLPGLADQFEGWSRILIEAGVVTEGVPS